MQKFLFSFLACLFLVGCATPTPYQKNGLLGGYKDKKVSDGVYEVEFQGNGYCTLELVKEYALRRAEELCGSPDFKHNIQSALETEHGGTYAAGMIIPLSVQKPKARGTVWCK